MQMNEASAGTIIYERGKEQKILYLLTRGTVKADYKGGSYQLRAGDIIGLCEMNRKETCLQYQAEDAVALLPYADSYEGLKKQLVNNGEAMKYFVSSLFRQLNEICGKYKMLQNEAGEIWQYLSDSYGDYVGRCLKRNIAPGILPEYDRVKKPDTGEAMSKWFGGYYATLEQMLSIWDHNNTDYDFIWGFLLKAGEDISQMLAVCSKMQDYKEEMSSYFLSEGELDLFELYAGLYLEEVEENGSAGEKALNLKIKIREIISFIQNHQMADEAFIQRRCEEFEKSLAQLEKTQENTSSEAPDLQKQMEEITGSLDKILKYAECGSEVETNFKKYLQAYKKLENKSGTDESVRMLRHQLTALFYKVYVAAFQVSVKEAKIPTVIKMFFDFGYVDEELAGVKNALYLYQLEQNMPTSPEKGVYSPYEWLMAIYTGKKEPCRNEFDLDYPEYLREQKKTGKLTAQQEAALLDNRASKVMFELEHVFPSVNKVTYGRPSTFCPVFSKHNILKPLNTILVTAQKATDAISEIRGIDYGAFHRETMYAEPDKGIPKEVISVEVLPDIILTPNIGSRGIMWQEIEGKKRTTPARMMCSIFQMEDLSLILTRLAAEFRWEMCKRIQGGRWNDVTERSLTSEYCDYAQFYRKNKDLSPDTKEKIKTQLGKAKNSYKEMFIMDYIQWVRYESIGSPRLNKVVRGIMFTYCPFAEGVRNKLTINPLYKDYVDKHKIKMNQRLHHVDNVCQKLANGGKEIPPEIEEYKRFLSM